MVTDGKYKYIQREPYGECEFYDLVNDPFESINLYNDKAYTDKIITFKNTLNNWFLKYVDPKVDASKESVYGFGQINFTVIKSKGKPSFTNPYDLNKK